MVGLFQPKPFYDSLRILSPMGFWGAEKREDKTPFVLRNEKVRSDSQQDTKQCHDGHNLVCWRKTL